MTKPNNVSENAALLEMDEETALASFYQETRLASIYGYTFSLDPEQGTYEWTFREPQTPNDFLNIVAPFEADENSIYQRILSQKASAHKPAWKLGLELDDLNDEVNPDSYWPQKPNLHLRASDFEAIFSVEFPQSDLPMILDRFKRHNRAWRGQIWADAVQELPASNHQAVASVRCPECDAAFGEHHVFRCPVEQCPFCPRPLVGCLEKCGGCERARVLTDLSWPPSNKDRIAWGMEDFIMDLCYRHQFFLRLQEGTWKSSQIACDKVLPDVPRLFQEYRWDSDRKQLVPRQV